MTITNYTFFSPTGTEFPVSSNADAKLYTMLGDMELNSFRRKDWETPIDTALNRQYTNTSLVVAGRYFELNGESVVLGASIANYIHANIDLANPTDPVSISVETADNSNDTDINNGSGVIKRCFDIATTDAMGVVSNLVPAQISTFDELEAKSVTADKVAYKNDTALVTISGNGAPSGKVTYQRKNGIVYITGSGNWGNIGTKVTKDVATLPDGFRPLVGYEISGSTLGGTASYSWRIATDGKVQLTPNPGGTSTYSGFSVSYPV